MKLTGGTLRGRTLPGRARPNTHPTAARVREALFSMAGQDLIGVSVLDAFGGTGMLAFEAVSRGAELAWVIERDGGAVRQIRRSAEVLGVADRVLVRRGSTPKDVPPGSFGLILLDPPYALDPSAVLAAVAPRVDADGLVVLEHTAARAAPDLADFQADTRRYGDTALTLYRRLGTPPEPGS